MLRETHERFCGGDSLRRGAISSVRTMLLCYAPSCCWYRDMLQTQTSVDIVCIVFVRNSTAELCSRRNSKNATTFYCKFYYICCNTKCERCKQMCNKIKTERKHCDIVQCVMHTAQQHCVRTGCSKVRPPVANTQTHRQDRIQYNAPQLASVQCNKIFACVESIV